MAALPKKKISRTRGKTRRAHNRATLGELVTSTKFAGLKVPGRFQKYYNSLEADSREVQRAMGLKSDKKARPSRRPKAALAAKPKATDKASSPKPTGATISARRSAPQKTTGGGK